MDQLPTEIILHVISFLHDTKDKIELLQVSRSLHSLITHNPSCWSPLDLSLHRERITNAALIGILRSCYLKIVVPRQQVLHSSSSRRQQQLQQQQQNFPQPLSSCRVGAQLDSIDLSGCHLLTLDALLMLVHTLPYLKVLGLNKYPATFIPEPLARHPRHYRRTRSTMIDMLRDDLYQCRPRHGLSSSTMDLSKQPLVSLSISDTTLLGLLPCMTFLTNLSLQHQPISYEACRVMNKTLKQLRHLDISSCQISVHSLQYLIRSLVSSLQSLKMLNLELSDMTLLCLQLFGEHSLTCLHLSCLDPQALPGLARSLRKLTKLTDFRLTRLPSGNVDGLISTLATCHLQSLDLSPKLEIYPIFSSHPRSLSDTASSLSLKASTSSSNRLPRQHSAKNTASSLLPPATKSPHAGPFTTATYSRSERNLTMTPPAFIHLSTFKYLVELRLCFPTLHNSKALTTFFKTATCPLQIFELRLRDLPPPTDDEDYLDGLAGFAHLHTLLLYSVPLTAASVSTILQLHRLNAMTIHDAKELAKVCPLFLRRWLSDLPHLRLLRMDRVPFAWTSITDLLPSYPHNYHPDHPLYHGDSMFIKTDAWEWVE